jgi:hypothetical protein
MYVALTEIYLGHYFIITSHKGSPLGISSQFEYDWPTEKNKVTKRGWSRNGPYYEIAPGLGHLTRQVKLRLQLERRAS